jgi:hypothetical protein
MVSSIFGRLVDMSHNIISLNGETPSVDGTLAFNENHDYAAKVTDLNHSGSPNNAQVGDYAQIRDASGAGTADASYFSFIDADASAIKSNTSYSMGFTLEAVGVFYVELVMKFIADANDAIVIQIVDSANNPVGPKAYYGNTVREYIYPTTITALIDNTTAGSNYYYRVQEVTNTPGQPTPNSGSSYLKCIKL